MSTWFRLDDSTPWDPRVLELGVILGDEDKALACLIRLWAWERSGAPTGTVKGEHADAVVERAAGWRGEPGAFAKACRATGLLVKTRSGLRSPGNAERLGRVTRRYAGGDASVTGVTRTAAERQREYRARQRAAKEAANTTQDSVNATSEQTVTRRNGDTHGTVRNADVTGSVQEKEPPHSPSVTPPVTPGVTTPTAPVTPPSLTLVPSAPEAPTRKRTKKGTGELNPIEAAVFRAWVETWKLGPAWVMTAERRKVIADRLAEGRTEADIIGAVRGSKFDSWSERPKNIGLELLLRPGNFERFLDWSHAGHGPVRAHDVTRPGFVPYAATGNARTEAQKQADIEAGRRLLEGPPAPDFDDLPAVIPDPAPSRPLETTHG